MLTLDKIYHAKYVLQDEIRQTDMIYSPTLSEQCGCEVYLKTENLQVTGSFKVRGAYYKISYLSEEEKAKGVIACSAGNHAQGVALASKKFGIKSIIFFMPPETSTAFLTRTTELDRDARTRMPSQSVA